MYACVFGSELKRVRLNNLEMMPKVTDTLFILVFRHMKLRKLNLTSNSPINSVSSTIIFITNWPRVVRLGKM